MISTRFSVSLHILSILAHGRSHSAAIAQEIGTNPVVVRRLLRPLIRAGWAATAKGGPGGVWLRQDPHEIRLSDVWHAVQSATPRRDGSTDAIARHPTAPPMIASALADAEAAIVRQLRRYTLRDALERKRANAA